MHQYKSRVKSLAARLAVVVGSVALVAGMTSVSAQAATTVQPDGSWQRIITQGGIDGGTQKGPYEFTTTAALTKITVLDAFCHGDEFHVFDNGVLLGDTSHVTVADDDDCAFTLFLPEIPGRPNAALADPGFSRGEFYVAPGRHSLEVTNKVVSSILASSTGTGAFFRLDVVDLAGNAAIQLTNSSGTLLSGGTVSYYANGWHTLGTTDSTGTVAADIPAGRYSFAMTYQGTRQQINNVEISGTSTTVAFQTADVAVQLSDSNGDALATGAASYYANGWHTIGATGDDGTAAVQMLPGKYSFAMTYQGTRQQINNVEISGTSTTVAFQTADVAVQLSGSNGDALATGGASYYANGWHTIGATGDDGTAAVQMLPGKYSFAMTYQGTRQQINNVEIAGASTNVAFQTGTVHSASGEATSYYAGSWRPFVQDMQLLSGTYTFRFVTANGMARNQQFTLHVGTNAID